VITQAAIVLSVLDWSYPGYPAVVITGNFVPSQVH